jgi:hypothetical protein
MTEDSPEAGDDKSGQPDKPSDKPSDEPAATPDPQPPAAPASADKGKEVEVVAALPDPGRGLEPPVGNPENQGKEEDKDEEDDDGDDEDDDGEDEDDDEDEDEDEDEEPRLKYARLTQHLGAVYRNGDATSAFLVAGDKMVGIAMSCPVRTAC